MKCISCKATLYKIGPAVWTCKGCGLVYMTEKAKRERMQCGLSIPSTPSVLKAIGRGGRNHLAHNLIRQRSKIILHG